MKKIFIPILIFAAVFSLRAGVCAPKDKPIDNVARFLKEKSYFTDSQIDTLVYRLRYAESEKLPVIHLASRIKEGVAKKRDFSEIIQLIDRKINQFREAKVMLEKFAKKGMVVKEKKYCAHVLGEIFEMGYPEPDFSEIANMAILGKIKCEDILQIAKLQMKLQREGIPFKETKEIITGAILKNMKPRSIKNILALLSSVKTRGLDLEKARKIITEGIEKNNMFFIEKNIKMLK